MKQIFFALALLSLINIALADGAPRKLPVPDAAGLKQATAVVDGAYRNAIARAITPAQQRDLAKQMLQDGLDTKNDPDGRYAVMTRAATLALQGGDLRLAFKAVEAINSEYDVDALKMKADFAAAASKAIRGKPELHGVAATTLLLINDAISADRYDVARQGTEAALSAARLSGDRLLFNSVTLVAGSVQACANGFESEKAPLAVLAKNPADPQANLAVGRYQCFLKGNWEAGLPMLVAGSNATLSGLAANDLAGAATAEDRSKLGDAWWNVAEGETDPAKTHIQGRAGRWYTTALPGLAGLARAKAESRLHSLADSPLQSVVTPGSLTLNAKNSDWTDMGILPSGKYTVEITGKVHLHYDEAAFITGPVGKDFQGHLIGTVTIDIGGKSYRSNENGRDVEGGRAVDIVVAEASTGRMKVDDLTYDDNSGSYTITIIKRN
ncbi:MAG: hypothetical protein JWP03_2477 [Phycisphaerales bacterium]|nr:hypothetical protein [Phycisphaerales bacterium]